MSFLKTSILTHRQQVTRLYKQALKEARNWKPEFYDWRFECTVIRDRFEKNRNIKDLVQAKKLLLEGERELAKNKHPFPFQFANSPGGISYDRNPRSPDFVMDQWHPLEKAQFPDYFTKRVQLKKEFIDWYKNKYGVDSYNPEIEGVIHTDYQDDKDKDKSHH